MKKRVFNLLILVVALATTLSTFSQRKVETTHLIVKSAKNAAVLGTDETGRVVEKELDLDLSNLVTKDSISNYITSDDKGYILQLNDNAGISFTRGYSKGEITLTNGSAAILGHGTDFTNSSTEKGLSWNWAIYVIVPEVGMKLIGIDDISDDENATMYGVYDGNSYDNKEGVVWNYPTGTYKYYTYENPIVSGLSYGFGHNDIISGKYNLGVGGYNNIHSSYTLYTGTSIESGINKQYESHKLMVGDNLTHSGSFSTIVGANSEKLSESTRLKNDHVYSFGSNNKWASSASFLYGSGLTTGSYNELALGFNNTKELGNFESWIPTDRLFTIGNGTNLANKSDALTILKNGKISAPSFDMAEITDAKDLVTLEKLQSELSSAGGVSSIVAGTNVAIDNTDPANPIINVNGGINSTDLTYVPASNQGTVESSNGTDAVIPVADATNAGLMPSDFTDEGVITGTVQITNSSDSNNMNLVSSSPTVDVKYRRVGKIITYTVRLPFEDIDFNAGNAAARKVKGQVEISFIPPAPKTDFEDFLNPLQVHFGIAGDFFETPYNVIVERNYYAIASGDSNTTMSFEVEAEATSGISTAGALAVLTATCIMK